MKVALVHPPEAVHSIGSEVIQHPINLASIAAYIQRDNRAEVQIWDYAVIKNVYKDFRTRVRSFKPDIVGFSCVTPLIIQGARLADIAKQESPEALTVVGGPHVSAIPERTLSEFESFDMGAIGEGEATMAEIVRARQEGRPMTGILSTVLRSDGEIVCHARRPLIKNLDDLPYPERDLVDFDLYRGSSTPGLDRKIQRITELFTSRGCPAKCVFCASSVTHGNRVRFRSHEHVMGEVRQCIERYGIQHFTIDDDTFTHGSERFFAICESMHELGVSWDCDSRVDSVNAEMLRMMANSGCKKIAFGVESGSPRVLELIKKHIRVDQIEPAFRWAREAGILTSAFIMIASHPSETLEDVEETLKLIKRIRPDFVMVYIAVPYPGTELYTDMSRAGLIYTEDWNEYDMVRTRPTWRTEHFMPHQIVNLQQKTYRQIYLRPSFILHKLLGLRSKDDFLYACEKGITLLRFLAGCWKESRSLRLGREIPRTVYPSYKKRISTGSSKTAYR